jgi:large subunit ribosomal protein L1
MAKLSKRQKTINEKVTIGKLYDINEAITLLKDLPPVKFDQSVELAVNLGIDSRKSDQVVRGSTVLPNGTGKSVRVAVFAQGENAQKAQDAGADIVGFEDLAEQIKGGDLNFDVVIATPDAMRVVGQLGQVLGPRGLMPNPKVGTVTPDVVTAINNAKAGQVRFRADKAGIVHCSLGKLTFENDLIIGNLEAVLVDLVKAKPASAKGIYVKKVSLSSTQGPGLAIEQSTLSMK